MPSQWAHSLFWAATSSTVVAPPPGPSRGGYPGWQASVVLPSLVGAIGAWWDQWRDWLVGWYRLDQRIHRLPQARRDVLLQTLTVLESPVYTHARKAVRTTAVTVGFRDPQSWVSYSRDLKANPKQAENTWRHVRACRLLQESWAQTSPGSTLTRLSNPQQNLLIELAYQEYARRPWGDA